MNSRQRRTRDHQERMRSRKMAKRILKSKWAGPIDRLFARITLMPNATKPDPRFHWWGAGPRVQPQPQPSTQPRKIMLTEEPRGDWLFQVTKRRVFTQTPINP